MIEIHKTAAFETWEKAFHGTIAGAAVTSRIYRLSQGLQGDSKALGSGLHELRVHHGAGYRVYFTWQSGSLVLLLCAGEKSGQTRDIARARRLMLETGHAHHD